MLGKLARWLRILGYDVKYSNKYGDREILDLSIAENRIILTRDFELYKKALSYGCKALFVKGKSRAEKLAEVAKEFGIRLNVDTSISRCPKCNSRIVQVSKNEVLDRIPAFTSTLYSEFWICPNCGQVYWKGSHWRRIDETLEETRRLLKSMNKET